MTRCGIIGANGITGGELIRILLQHPEVSLDKMGSRSLEGKPISEVHDFLYHRPDLTFCSANSKAFTDLDIVFLALPHGTSSQAAKILREAGVKVIDLGADFRLNDYALYAEWYAAEHHWPELLPSVPYGLPELYEERIRGSDLVANPGCFPTSIILALAPLLNQDLIHLDLIVADAYSGVTGAGKTPTDSTHFPNINENVWAYKLGRHRHLPEILENLEALADAPVGLVFNPHLVALDRGILATVTARLKEDMSQEELFGTYENFYAEATFVRLRRAEQGSNVKAVRGSNFCDLTPLRLENQTVVVTSAIDNLVKGAAGQAVQNMNLMMGWDSDLGLDSSPLKP